MRCIGEPTWLRILKLVPSGDKCLVEIVEALNKEQSLVSHHLRALEECNIVAAREEVQPREKARGQLLEKLVSATGV